MTKLALLFLFAEAAYVAAVSPSDWKILDRTLKGRLQLAAPLSRPCFSIGDGCSIMAPDDSACEVVRARNADHLSRTEVFGSYQNTQWETCQTTGSQCILDWTNPFNQAASNPPRQCTIGNIPPYFIEVTGADDVRAALIFTRLTKVPLVVKNTGHDYHGRSAGVGALGLWTHKLKKLEFNPTFVPERCSGKPVSAITMGAGVQFVELYNFATQNNVTVVGGADASVGASGGWLMGGGHGALSPTLGLGVDRVLEFKIVTADGVLRTANRCQNTDLFWALRGGGGGTFGVVLETTTLATPRVTVQVLLGRYSNTKANSAQLIKALAKTSVKFASDGWGGYITPPFGSAIWVNPVLDSVQARESSAEVVKALQAVNATVSYFTLPNYELFFKNFIEPNPDPVGRPQAIASRIIDEANIANDTLIDAFTKGILDSDFGQILAVGPYGFKDFDPAGTSVHPKWRTSVWHVFMSYSWNFDSTLTQRIDAYQRLNNHWAPVRDLTPGSAAYLNEADVYEPDYQNAFWGSNYPRLLSIKNKYDPQGIFDCWRCVGWKGADDSRYKCYPKTD